MPYGDELGGLVRMILETSPEELGCDECLERVDLFVEEQLAGKNAAEAMPLVRDHLEKCGDCREEFEALLAALRATEEPASAWSNPLGAARRLWRRLFSNGRFRDSGA